MCGLLGRDEHKAGLFDDPLYVYGHSSCKIMNIPTSYIPYTAKHSRGKLRSVYGFSLNHECIPTNYGLVNWHCKSTCMLARKFSHKWKFCTLAVKVFPLESFAVYGNW